jgi:hypothetical protein
VAETTDKEMTVMIGLQVILLVSVVIGLLISYIEFNQSQRIYESIRDSEDFQNGLTLQVASHQVRVAVLNLVLHTVQVIIAGLVLTVLWTKRFDWDLTLILVTGLTMVGTLSMIKQLMYRYDRALIMDTAKVAHREIAKRLSAASIRAQAREDAKA